MMDKLLIAQDVKLLHIILITIEEAAVFSETLLLSLSIGLTRRHTSQKLTGLGMPGSPDSSSLISSMLWWREHLMGRSSSCSIWDFGSPLPVCFGALPPPPREEGGARTKIWEEGDVRSSLSTMCSTAPFARPAASMVREESIRRPL